MIYNALKQAMVEAGFAASEGDDLTVLDQQLARDYFHMTGRKMEEFVGMNGEPVLPVDAAVDIDSNQELVDPKDPEDLVEDNTDLDGEERDESKEGSNSDEPVVPEKVSDTSSDDELAKDEELVPEEDAGLTPPAPADQAPDADQSKAADAADVVPEAQPADQETPKQE